jgi:ABC-type branched-subunit amino acid transport system ATPase component
MRQEFILLDEPAAGLTIAEEKELSERLCQVRKDGITLFIIEHHMGMVMEIADEMVVLDHGKLIAEGPPDEVKKDPQVIEAYVKGKRVHA